MDRRCTAKSSRTGKRCAKAAIRGGTVCRTHGGAAPQVRRAAEVRQAILDGQQVLEQLSVLARADIGRVLPADDPIRLLPAEVRTTIRRVKDTRAGRTIEMHDAIRALELIARITGQLKEAAGLDQLAAAMREDLTRHARGSQ